MLSSCGSSTSISEVQSPTFASQEPHLGSNHVTTAMSRLFKLDSDSLRGSPKHGSETPRATAAETFHGSRIWWAATDESAVRPIARVLSMRTSVLRTAMRHLLLVRSRRIRYNSTDGLLENAENSAGNASFHSSDDPISSDASKSPAIRQSSDETASGELSRRSSEYGLLPRVVAPMTQWTEARAQLLQASLEAAAEGSEQNCTSEGTSEPLQMAPSPQTSFNPTGLRFLAGARLLPR